MWHDVDHVVPRSSKSRYSIILTCQIDWCRHWLGSPHSQKSSQSKASPHVHFFASFWFLFARWTVRELVAVTCYSYWYVKSLIIHILHPFLSIFHKFILHHHRSQQQQQQRRTKRWKWIEGTTRKIARKGNLWRRNTWVLPNWLRRLVERQQFAVGSGALPVVLVGWERQPQIRQPCRP